MVVALTEVTVGTLRHPVCCSAVVRLHLDATSDTVWRWSWHWGWEKLLPQGRIGASPHLLPWAAYRACCRATRLPWPDCTLSPSANTRVTEVCPVKLPDRQVTQSIAILLALPIWQWPHSGLIGEPTV
jgi:hypothetical protein